MTATATATKRSRACGHVGFTRSLPVSRAAPADAGLFFGAAWLAVDAYASRISEANGVLGAGSCARP